MFIKKLQITVILGVIMFLLYSPFLFTGEDEQKTPASMTTSSVGFAGEDQNYLYRTGWIGENHDLTDFKRSYKTSNLRDSLNVEFISRCLYGPPYSVFIRDTLAFVGTEAAMMIFDISCPLEPSLLGHIPIYLGWGWDIYVADEYAYVAQWGGPYGGIQIVDISDPTTPQEVVYYEADDWVLSIYATSDYAYACVGTGLLILDVSNPSNLSEVSFLDFGESNWTQEVLVVGNHAYVAAAWVGLKIVDVSNPAAPNVVGTFQSGDAFNRGVRVRDNYAYLSFDSMMEYSLVIIDISDPTQPQYIGECESSGFNPYIAGNYAYVNRQMMSPGGLQIIDISDPTNPFEAGSTDVEGSPWEIDGDTSFAYVAAQFGGLQVVDVSDVSASIPVADYNTGFAPYSVEVVGNYAYVADCNWPAMFNGIHKSILWILDISNSANPIEISSFETGGDCKDVSIVLPYAYIADISGGVRIVDVADPTNPWEVGHYANFEAEGIDVAGDYAYVCGHGMVDSLFILDISEPTNPLFIGSCNVPNPRRVFVDGDFAYVASPNIPPNGGMYIIDVSNPENPFEAGFYNTHGSGAAPTLEIYVMNDLAYIADGTGGLRIVNVSDPANPVELSNLATRGPASSIFISGSLAYVGTVQAMGGIPGVEVINISNPLNPITAGYYDLYNVGYDVYVEGDFIYVANGQCGFYILRYTGGSSIDDEYSETSLSILSQNYPNPFNPTTTISYKLEKTGKIILNIYNLRGQLVKKFVHSRETVGKHSVVWDGMDEGGKKLSSGIYFYQIETPNFKSQIKKMVLLR